MPDPLVLRDLTKRYGAGPAVIEAFSYTFEPGTATGLFGPNGSGKTTLLRLLSVLAFPTAGSVHFGEVDIHRAPYRYLRHVGLVQDDADLPRYMTAVEAIAYVLRARGLWNEAAPSRIEAELDGVLLDERRNALIGTYSTGMLRKTQLALAFATDPAVLLLDEPLRGLDAGTRTAVLHRFERLKDDGCILLLASHFEEALEAVCDRILRLPFPAA